MSKFQKVKVENIMLAVIITLLVIMQVVRVVSMEMLKSKKVIEKPENTNYRLNMLIEEINIVTYSSVDPVNIVDRVEGLAEKAVKSQKMNYMRLPAVSRVR